MEPGRRRWQILLQFPIYLARSDNFKMADDVRSCMYFGRMCSHFMLDFITDIFFGNHNIHFQGPGELFECSQVRKPPNVFKKV